MIAYEHPRGSGHGYSCASSIVHSPPACVKTMAPVIFDSLRKYILSSEGMSEEEFELIRGLMIPKRLRRRQYLLQAGDVCTTLAFVSKGCLRLYDLDDFGRERILLFAIEGHWITDVESWRARKPATRNIDALEDSELLLIDNPALDKLTVSAPKWDRYFKGILEDAFKAAIVRISDFVGASAEERYLRFLSTSPELSQRIPLHQIASYLGITPQSLSRIRRELAERK